MRLGKARCFGDDRERVVGVLASAVVTDLLRRRPWAWTVRLLSGSIRRVRLPCGSKVTEGPPPNRKNTPKEFRGEAIKKEELGASPV